MCGHYMHQEGVLERGRLGAHCPVDGKITVLSIGLMHYRLQTTLWQVKAEHTRQKVEKTEHQLQT
ncbi:MAG: hypothetical protein ACL7BU_06430 [Candidatus Phlomobacter fragariae]